MADEKFSLKDIEQAVLTNTNQVMSDFNQGIITFEEAIKALTTVTKNDISLTKRRIIEANKLTEAIKKNIETQQRALGGSNILGRITNVLSGGAKEGGNTFEEMYRVRQRFGGLEQIFSGNFKSGIRDFAGSFKNISTIMKGPYFTAISVVVSGLLKLDDALAKATKTATSMTGGLQSDFLNKNGFAAAVFNRGLKQDLYNIGMQKEFENISGALVKGYGMGSYQGRQQDYITSMAYAQKGLSSFGISADTTNNLLSNLRLLDNKDTTGIYAQLKRLSDNVVKMKYLSPDEAMRQMSSLFDQTKMLGINFEWANRAITQFEKGLKDGTISLSDFAAVNRSLRSGGISKNAGIAEMVIDYASRSGLNLPQNLISSDPLGRGFALSTKSMLSNNQFALAYQGTIQEKIDQMGGATKQDKAARLQYFLSQLGVNIGPEAAESAIKSNGQIDLIGSKILGTRMGEKEDEERKKAKEYQEEVESYYKGTTSWHKGVLDKMDKLINNTGKTFSEGAAEGMSSSSADIIRNLGALFNKQTWIDLANSGDFLAKIITTNSTRVSQ